MTTEQSTKNRAARGRLLYALPLALLIAGTIQVFAKQQTPSGSTTQEPTVQGEAARDNDVETAYVAVLDKKGNAVTDLKREEFSVKEDGEVREVVEVESETKTPLTIGVLTDVSGSTSMDKQRKEKLLAFPSFLAKTLQGSDEAFVAGFADRCSAVTGLTNDAVELRTGLQKIAEARPSGATALYDCLVSAAETLEKERGRRRVILAMSDFEDNTSRQSLQKTVLRMQETGTAVFPLVELTLPTDSRRARKQALEAANAIAKESGGAAYVFDKPQGLETALERIRIVLRNSYALKYRTSGAAKKGKSTALKIEVQRKHVRVVAAGGRVAEVR
jgi:VWFA-related protein